ncbi:DUF4283 domain-containing protein [Raphanus sativus]|nr:DUF4283 domain-containing protein [Raphanus sativus]
MATLDDGDSEGGNPNGAGGLTGSQGGDLVCGGGLESSHGFVGTQARASDLFGRLIAGAQEESEHGRLGASGGSPFSDKDAARKTDSPWLKKNQAGSSEPVIEVVGLVACDADF